MASDPLRERMPSEDFFALPDGGLYGGGLGYTAIKIEGAPLYRDEGGYHWYAGKLPNGDLARFMNT